MGGTFVLNSATDGNEALVTLKSTRADLILISLMLPDADGLVLCFMVSAHFPAPIIVLRRAGDVDRALANGSGESSRAIACLRTYLGPVQVPKQRDYEASGVGRPQDAQAAPATALSVRVGRNR